MGTPFFMAQGNKLLSMCAAIDAVKFPVSKLYEVGQPLDPHAARGVGSFDISDLVPLALFTVGHAATSLLFPVTNAGVQDVVQTVRPTCIEVGSV